MRCKLCSSSEVSVDYCGSIRLGMAAGYTEEDVTIYRCRGCGVLWHEYPLPEDYYKSEEYRKAVEGDSDPENYFLRHDCEVLPKLKFTGTDIYRSKTVADIGCGGGSFLDFLSGVAETTIAVEPSETYRNSLAKRGHRCYAYTAHALTDFGGQADVATSFDVIEHVNEPLPFLKEIHSLLKPGGKLVVGTPTDYPILRRLVGKPFERFIFNANHPWVFDEKSLTYLLKEAGFEEISIKQTYRFGIGNVLSWLATQEPHGDIKYDEIPTVVDKVWKTAMKEQGMGEYLVAYAQK